jgi:nucleoside-diphosphate-sugar epimerase
VGETRHIYLDASKAKKELGWAPTFTLEEGLQETVNYFKTVERVS